MKLIVLGSGAGLPSKNRVCSGYALEFKSDIVLFDCGSGVTKAFLTAGLDPKKVSSVFISHMHPDHVGDLPRFIQLLYHSGRKDQVNLYVPEEAIEITRKYLDACYLFQEKFWFDLIIEPIPNSIILKPEIVVKSIPNNHMSHMKKICQEQGYPNKCECFSFLIKADSKIILYSSDIDSIADIKNHLNDLDLLIIETSHIDLNELLEFIPGRDVKKILFTHIADDLEEDVNSIVSKNKFGLNLLLARDNDVIEV